MKKIIGFIVTLFVVIAGYLLLFVKAGASDSLVITNINIVDVRQGVILQDSSLVIRDGVIKSIRKSNKRGTDENTIDGNGAYVIPGLIDMHVHLASRPKQAEHDGRLYIANGVTAVREMASGCWSPCRPSENRHEDLKKIAAAFERGDLVGPRIAAMSTPPVHGPVRVRFAPGPADKRYDLDFYPPRTDADGRALARWALKEGYDLVKVYNSVPRDAYFGLLDEANKLDLEVSGHLPRAISFEEAIKAGQSSFEHARAPALGCSHFAESFTQLADDIISQRVPWSPKGRIRSHLQQIIDEFDPERSERLFTLMKEEGAALTPTHVTRAFDAFAMDDDFIRDPRLDYVPAVTLQEWFGDAASTRRHVRQSNPPYTAFFDHGLKITEIANDMGVKLMFGTDAGDSYIFPGFSAQDELRWLVKAGLSPWEALKTATATPGQYLELPMGFVEEDYYADLVLLKENPLDSIDAIKSIQMVVVRGVPYSRDRLDELLQEARAAARSPAFNLDLALEINEANQ